MTLLNQQEQEQLRAAVAAAELKTAAELVTVLASKSDDYHYIPLLWAAFVALALPLLSLWFYPVPAFDLYIAQLLTFMVFGLLFRVPAILHRLIPAPVRAWRAANMARRVFLEQGLHHTQGETGVLIFVSEAERYVEILVDRGISQHISDEQWQQTIDQLTAAVKAGNTLVGFIDCVNRCGELLAEHIPAQGDNPNELSDGLVIIE